MISIGSFGQTQFRIRYFFCFIILLPHLYKDSSRCRYSGQVLAFLARMDIFQLSVEKSAKLIL